MVVGLNSPKSSVLHIERSIKLTLELKLHKARSIQTFLTKQRIEELPESLSLAGSLFLDHDTTFFNQNNGLMLF